MKKHTAIGFSRTNLILNATAGSTSLGLLCSETVFPSRKFREYPIAQPHVDTQLVKRFKR